MLKLKCLCFLILILNLSLVHAQEDAKSVFFNLNLNYRGLERVKAAVEAGNVSEAEERLLEYYRNRTGVVDPSINLTNTTLSKDDKILADDAMEHKFFSMKAFQPSFFYGKDIDWAYWPVKDHELRFQLHRIKWFAPMGKAFFVTKDEKYAKEWMFQFEDWIKKNPLIDGKKTINGEKVNESMLENESFAWRPLETAGRLVTYGSCLEYFKMSKYFTPDFLCHYLENIQRHATFVNHNYSLIGNHLLFEAQYMYYAGVFFPEFKDAPLWRKAGVDILSKQMEIQVYPDGMQFELDPGYHNGAILSFLVSMKMAELNGYKNDFSEKYNATVHKMIEAYYNLLYPDGTSVQFSDTRTTRKEGILKLFKDYTKVFPDDSHIKYFATDGQEGSAPGYTSKAFMNAGFFMFRTGWDMKSTALILKAGPPAFWHNQPDNGTFELFHNGRNFFPDAGSYVYGGDSTVLKKRDAFRSTSAHNTLTLNDSTITTTNSKCLLWKSDQSTEILVIENPSYNGLTHRRSVFFVNKKFFVIVDEAIGDRKGKVGIHYHFCEGDVKWDFKSNIAYTNFSDKNNILIKVFSDSKSQMSEQESWVSYVYDVKLPRKAFVVNTNKDRLKSVRFITVVLPVSDEKSAPAVSSNFVDKSFNKNSLDLKVKVGNQEYRLAYKL